MIELELTGNVFITIEYGKQITAPLRLALNNLQVILSGKNSPEEVETEFLDSPGSSEGWLHLNRVDSWAFDPSTRLLKGGTFYYNENNQVPACLPLLTETEKIVGIPRLREHSHDFEVEPFLYRYYHMENNRLLCFNEDFKATNDRILEVIVCNDLSLFFLNGRYCAWVLYHPEIRLVNRIAEVVDHTSDPFLRTSLRDAFDLICDETVKRMNDKDAYTLQQLAALHNRIEAYGAVEGSPLDVLRDWLFEVADRFYRIENIKGLFVGRYAD
ncbi:MAG TPA: hypothetical protein VIM79_23100 [Niastella sp.]